MPAIDPNAVAALALLGWGFGFVALPLVVQAWHDLKALQRRIASIEKELKVRWS